MFTNEERKMFFFSFIHYDHSAMTKPESFFFSFSYYEHYAMIRSEKKFFFHLATTITTL